MRQNLNPKAGIGILDSGLGGLSIYKELAMEMPGEYLLYFADTKHMPYGTRLLTEVKRFALDIVKELISEPIKALVIGCNTASAAALKTLRETFPDLPFIGMEPAVKPAAIESRSGKIGILATPAAFNGEHFENVIRRFAADVEVLRQPCRGLAEFIEIHPLDHPELKPQLEKYILPLLSQGVDALVLACTHYTLVKETIREICGDGIKVIDPSLAIARRTRQVLLEKNLLNRSGMGGSEFWVSGDPDKFSRRASALLGMKVAAKQKNFTRKEDEYHSALRKIFISFSKKQF